MNILIFNWQDIRNPLGGGAEVHMHEIFKRLAARGHRITLYCSAFEGAPAQEEIDGIRVIREGGRNLFNFYVPRRYRREFRQSGFDIVIDDLNKIPFYTPLFVREPLMAISHHFFGKSIFLEAGPVAGSYVYAAEKLVDRIYRNTPFAVVSESTLQEFLQRGFPRRNFRIVPNCIDQAQFPMQVCAKNAAPLVSYFGRLKKYKSVDHVLQAFARIHSTLPAARLQIIGAGTFREALESLAVKLGIADKTSFLGYVSEEEKIVQLGRSHCVVNPSMKEGWGITNIEANACGTPVISANVPGLRDSVQPEVSGLLYEYGNIASLADAMLLLLRDHDRQRRLAEGAVQWARTFDWDKSADRMIEYAAEIIEKRAVRQASSS